jgi:hypothetical protein
MTESEWHSSDDVRAMLAFVEPSAADHRMRLFVLACCRRLWGDSPDERTRVALEFAEHLLADSEPSMTSRKITVPAGEAVLECGASEYLGGIRLFGTMDESVSLLKETGLEAAVVALGCSQGIHSRLPVLVAVFADSGLGAGEQAALLRDVVPVPFRLLDFPAHWRTANDGAVGHVASEIERDEAFEGLPFLADALMDAGCDCREILDHLQAPGPHVRGCWALDAVLGKC